MNETPIIAPRKSLSASHSPLAPSHSADEFVLVRCGRDVIEDAPMRLHLLRLPALERTCPVQKVFYLRSGVRIVGPERFITSH